MWDCLMRLDFAIDKTDICETFEYVRKDLWIWILKLLKEMRINGQTVKYWRSEFANE